MKRKRSPITLALSRPNTLGKIVECSADGVIVKEQKTLLCDGKLVAVKQGKSWKEIQL